MSRPLDSIDRNLSMTEKAEQNRLRPALDAWRHYLDRNGAHASFDEAERRRAPILSRHEPVAAMLGYQPVIVNPRYALAWAQANGHGGRAGSGSPLSYSTMVEALEFMRATPATSFRARVDAYERRRREGYYHLTWQIVYRLRGNRYVPTLTRRPGRPRTSDVAAPAPGATPRAVRRAAGDESLSIVRHWLQVTEPTALLHVARDQRRPLAIRPAGRPTRSMHRGAQVRRELLIGRVEMLVDHAAEHGQWRIPSAAELGKALDAHAQASPLVVSPVTRFSTPDAPSQRNLRGWWRFTLSAFGRPLLEPADLAGEVEHYRATAQRPAEPAPPAPVGFVLPAGCDPAWLDDPQYRDSILMTDDDYERWRAGL